MKVSDLEGALLDYWVARAEGKNHAENPDWGNALPCAGENHDRCAISHRNWNSSRYFEPSKNWAHAGPIIDREQISTWRYDDAYGDDFPQNLWFATLGGVHGWDDGSIVCNVEMTGETALIAAMRAYVASKFGEEVPDEAAL